MARSAGKRIEAELRARVAPLLEGQGYELVDLKYGGSRQRPAVTILADKPGGVDTGDCQHLSQQISLLLDALDPIPGRYDLVVSSPGIERPLTKPADYERFAGKLARITVSGANGSRRRIEGRLRGLAEDVVLVSARDQVQRIPVADIQEARLVFDWDEERAAAKQSEARGAPAGRERREHERRDH